MKIELKKFGEMLISRPSGKDAYLALKAYSLRDVTKEEPIEVDFSGVKVFTPSWADEFITPLKKEYKNVTFINTKNPTVQATFKTIFGDDEENAE